TLTPLNYAGGNSPALVAPVGDPRIDLLTIDSAGTLAWTAGSEDASPTPPNCPAHKTPICYVYCKTTMDRILDYEEKDDDATEAYIYKDVRPFVNLGGKIPEIYSAVGTTNIETSNSDYEDMTDMSITQTFSAGTIVVTFTAPFAVTSDTSYVRLVVDDVEKKFINLVQSTGDAATLIYQGAIAAGSRTIKVQWKVTIGSFYQSAVTYGERTLTNKDYFNND
ncbi:unnamed protein product, partial [marine sediment metagenome]